MMAGKTNRFRLPRIRVLPEWRSDHKGLEGELGSRSRRIQKVQTLRFAAPGAHEDAARWSRQEGIVTAQSNRVKGCGGKYKNIFRPFRTCAFSLLAAFNNMPDFGRFTGVFLKQRQLSVLPLKFPIIMPENSFPTAQTLHCECAAALVAVAFEKRARKIASAVETRAARALQQAR